MKSKPSTHCSGLIPGVFSNQTVSSKVLIRSASALDSSTSRGDGVGGAWVCSDMRPAWTTQEPGRQRFWHRCVECLLRLTIVSSPVDPIDSRHGSVLAVLLVFAVNGFAMAQALARMPAVRDAVDASKGELGLALVGGGLGSLIAMPFTARLVDRFGSRRVVQVCVVLGTAGWAGLAFVPNVWVMGAVLVCAGAPIGVWDVAMNIQGSHVERRRGRSLMPYFHGAFSAGTVLGAGLAALAAWLGISLLQLPVLGVIGIAVGLYAVRAFVPEDDDVSGGAEHKPVARRGLTRLEVLLGLVCLGGTLAEGSANDWLALLLVDVHGAPEAFGALTLMAFNVTMMIGRISGGPAIDRFGRDRVARAGGVLAISGILLASQQDLLGLALAGGLLWGLGVSTIFPAAISAAGEIPGRGNRSIATVSMIAYGAFLFGAPTIGLLAEQVGLDRALLVVVLALVLMVVLAGNLRVRTAVQSATGQAADQRDVIQ